MPQNPGSASLENEIAELKRRISDLERANPLQNATIKKGGITLTSGGSLQIVDPTTGNTIVVAGALESPIYDRSSGVPQQGFELSRSDDGSLAMVLADVSPTTPPFKQALQVFDRAGNIVFSDDTNGGQGLAQPYVSGGIFFADTNIVRWPQTTSSTFVTIADGWYTVQNPRLSWDINMVADTGTTGQLQLWVNNVQVDVTKNVTSSFVDWFKTQVPVPGNPVPGTIIYCALMAKRTGGTGGVYAAVQRFHGDQSP